MKRSPLLFDDRFSYSTMFLHNLNKENVGQVPIAAFPFARTIENVCHSHSEENGAQTTVISFVALTLFAHK